MKERPILYSADMIKAKKEGIKSQTRRILKPQPGFMDDPYPDVKSHVTFRDILDDVSYYVACGYCPYGRVGDRLWAKETFRLTASIASDGADLKFDWGIDHVVYRADQEDVYAATDWKPSIYMPRWASRFLDEITGIRLELLQNISEVDARREGVQRDEDALEPDAIWPTRQSYRTAYRLLWDRLNPKMPWESNPFVWIIETKPVVHLGIPVLTKEAKQAK